MAKFSELDLANMAWWWQNCGSHTQYTAITSATTITAPPGACKVMMQNTTTLDVRYRTDGGDPTTTVGFLLQKDDGPRVVPVNAADTLVVIGESGAKLDLIWGKPD